MKNKTIDKFIKNLTELLEEGINNDKIDIFSPLCVLYKDMTNRTDVYSEFITELETYVNHHYFVNVFRKRKGDYEIQIIYYMENTHVDSNNRILGFDVCKNNYLITFYIDIEDNKSQFCFEKLKEVTRRGWNFSKDEYMRIKDILINNMDKKEN